MLLEVGAVGEDLRRDRLEHRSARLLPRRSVDRFAEVAGHGGLRAPPARRRCAERGFSTRIVRHPARRPASTSTSESPIIQLSARSSVEVGGGRQEHPGPRLAAVARPGRDRVDGVGVVEAVAVRRRSPHARSASSPNDALVGRDQLLDARPCPWPRRLVRDNDRTVVERSERRIASAAPRQSDVAGTVRRLGRPVGRVPDELVDHAVAVEEDGPSPLTSPPAASTDSHFPGAVTSAGCETSRCQTTAWNASTCGVRRSGGASDHDAGVGRAPRWRRPSRPTTPKTPAPDLARELDRADEVHRDVVLAGPAADGEHEDRVARDEARVRSHASKLVSQPSSFVRAVSSETLSVGA